ncbi:MAG: glycosyltransferase [Pseudomonadota bacterium]
MFQSPLHIVHIASAFVAGTFNSVRQLANIQSDMGHQVTVIHKNEPLPDDKLIGFRPSVQLLPWDIDREVNLSRDFPLILALRQELMRLGPDIVHCHSSKSGVIGRLAAFTLNLPQVYSPRGLSFFREDVSAFKRAVYRSAEYVCGHLGGVSVGCSSDELLALRTVSGRTALIQNGLDLDEINAVLEPIIREKKSKNNFITVALSGRISPQKNPATVASLVRKSPADWRWLWIGDGEDGDLIRETNRVEITGWVDRRETLARLASADIFFHPARWEGMPLALMEAMAVGLPVVASDIVGNRDLIRHGQNGFITSSDAEMFDHLSTLADVPGLRRSMGAASAKTIEDHYSAQGLSNAWLSIYRHEMLRVKTKSQRRGHRARDERTSLAG